MLTHRVNEAKTIHQKAQLARTLRGEVVVLLRCPAGDKDNRNCVNCQTLSHLWSKAAVLLLRAEKTLTRISKG